MLAFLANEDACELASKDHVREREQGIGGSIGRRCRSIGTLPLGAGYMFSLPGFSILWLRLPFLDYLGTSLILGATWSRWEMHIYFFHTHGVEQNPQEFVGILLCEVEVLRVFPSECIQD
jgi:hypothetical protein